jgi:aryl-alcohol dehydrogenase-like predicted oxidoreductase
MATNLFKGRATAADTRAFLEKRELNPGQIRSFGGVAVSSLGVGTYLGNMDEATDAKVTQACLQAMEHGVNFIDSAINYRGQRGERAVGEAIRRAILSGKFRREEFFVSTKGGFVPYEGKPTSDVSKLFDEQYVSKGLARPTDLVSGCHCLEPAYLNDQIERSRQNLLLETIDLYYLHNPETQLDELPERIFYDKLEKAFALLERATDEGRIGAYGLATWNAFREEPTSHTAIQLERCLEVASRAAKSLGHAESHFKAVQLPLNLAMPEGALLRTQQVGQNTLSAIDAAHQLGLSVAVSVPLFQSRLCHGLPDFILEKFDKEMSQAHCALAFATAFTSVDAAMVGMKTPEHVTHNLEFLKHRPLTEEQLRGVINAMIA